MRERSVLCLLDTGPGKTYPLLIFLDNVHHFSDNGSAFRPSARVPGLPWLKSLSRYSAGDLSVVFPLILSVIFPIFTHDSGTSIKAG